MGDREMEAPVSLAEGGIKLRKPPALAPTAPRTCHLPEWSAKESPTTEVCDGEFHLSPRSGVLMVSGTCPDRRQRQTSAAVHAERQRLDPVFKRLRCTPSLDNYDIGRHAGAQMALAKTRGFVEGGHGLFLTGLLALGKTHLLVASHLALVARGVRSVYVTMEELRSHFIAADATRFESAKKEAAEAALIALWSNEVIHIDELGEGPGDPSGKVYLAMKGAVDRCGARFAVAACRSTDELCVHPDVTEMLVSRFLDGAARVDLGVGDDQRVRRRV